ncbi:hypothetical protein ACJRO7_013336 [Eucalyptus globulus]|uniref:Uncharacterized protein n=1 Tax=Eucalyptus globulus TaxID=34317 RepID=A0ABD3L2K4_EUCGL
MATNPLQIGAKSGFYSSKSSFYNKPNPFSSPPPPPSLSISSHSYSFPPITAVALPPSLTPPPASMFPFASSCTPSTPLPPTSPPWASARAMSSSSFPPTPSPSSISHRKKCNSKETNHTNEETDLYCKFQLLVLPEIHGCEVRV